MAEAAQSNLTSAQQQYLEDTPATVVGGQTTSTSPGPPESSSPTALHAPVDPIAHCVEQLKDIFGLTVATDNNYLGFSDNGTKVTNVAASASNEWSSNLYYPGQDTLSYSQPGPPQKVMYASDSVPVYTDLQTEYTFFTFHYTEYGNGGWGCSAQ